MYPMTIVLMEELLVISAPMEEMIVVICGDAGGVGREVRNA